MRFPIPFSLADERALPVELDELKEHLRIQHSDQDWLLLRKIEEATAEAEKFIGCAIVAREFVLVLDEFPIGALMIDDTTVQSITSIRYYDADGAQQTLDSANYYLFVDRVAPSIELSPDAGWPATQVRRNAVTITYVAGHAADAAAVPANLRAAVLLRAATRFEYAEEVAPGGAGWAMLPDRLTFERLLAPFVIMHA